MLGPELVIQSICHSEEKLDLIGSNFGTSTQRKAEQYSYGGWGRLPRVQHQHADREAASASSIQVDELELEGLVPIVSAKDANCLQFGVERGELGQLSGLEGADREARAQEAGKEKAGPQADFGDHTRPG